MANIKAAMKSAKKDLVRRARNIEVKSTVRGAVRQARVACEADDLTAAAAKLQAANRLLDRAVSKGVIHRNTAARRKSRLAKLLASKQAEQQTEAK